MRSQVLGGAVSVLVFAAVAAACGSQRPGSGFGDTDAGSSFGGGSGSGSGSGGGGPTGSFGDGGPTHHDAGPCTNLQCKAPDCSSSGTQTTLTGTVYDPAGNLPLYDVYVYVPNATPAPIVSGNPQCAQCEAPASGWPIIGALTGPDGKFTIAQGPNDDWGVPAGSNIPLVIQIGKWRKQLTIKTVQPCAVNDLDQELNAGTGKARQLRLPANGSEGDMPLIAFTSGCDPAECFLRHVGIDDSEFVPPTSTAGHVHFYTGYNSIGSMPPSPPLTTPASSVSGGNQPSDTYQWWADATNLLKYDIVFNACDCYPNDRGAGSYAAMDTYLNGGGRLFTTHYYGNWFIPYTGTGDLQSVAVWGSDTMNSPMDWNGNEPLSEADEVDQSFPKGQAFAQWLQDNGISSSLGNITLSDLRDDIVATAPASCTPGTSCLSTRWIYNPGDMHPRYLSFNTPVSPAPAPDGGAGVQCGRAVYSDVHLSGLSDNTTFPNECNNPNIDNPPGHAVNEKALEFLFFDLSSCVQNESTPPVPPGPVQ